MHQTRKVYTNIRQLGNKVQSLARKTLMLNQKAFTLIELLLVLTLSSLLTLSLLSQSKIYKSLTEFSSIRALVMQINKLQQKAIASGDTVSLIFNNNWQIRQKDSIIELKKLIKPQLIRSTVPNTISFYPSGVVTPATILLRARNKNCTISISIYGKSNTNCL